MSARLKLGSRSDSGQDALQPEKDLYKELFSSDVRTYVRDPHTRIEPSAKPADLSEVWNTIRARESA